MQHDSRRLSNFYDPFNCLLRYRRGIGLQHKSCVGVFMNNSINTTLNARQGTYGDYSDVAAITQSIMRIVESGASYEQMSDVQKTSLFMIANKMARIVNGDPAYDDSWHDISGYATLVVNDLNSSGVPQAILEATK